MGVLPGTFRRMLSVMVIVLLAGYVCGLPPDNPNLKVLKLRAQGTRVTENDLETIMLSTFNLTELTGQTNPVYMTGVQLVIDMTEVTHTTVSKCEEPWDPSMDKFCIQRLFYWNHDAATNDQLYIPAMEDADAAFKIDLKKNPQIIVGIHYKHALDHLDYKNGFDLYYQLEPTKYEVRPFRMAANSLRLKKGREKTYGNANCRMDAPLPINLFDVTLHTHDLAVGASVWAYNTVSKKFREIVYNRPKINNLPIEQTVYPGEYLAARCIYNLSQVDHDIILEGEEMCRMVFKYYVDPEQYHKYYTDHPEDFDFHECIDTMGNEASKKLSISLPGKSRIPWTEFEGQA